MLFGTMPKPICSTLICTNEVVFHGDATLQVRHPDRVNGDGDLFGSESSSTDFIL